MQTRRTFLFEKTDQKTFFASGSWDRFFSPENARLMEVSSASVPDIPEMQAIYAHHVLHGTGTFEETPPSIEQMQERLMAGVSAGYDWAVARDTTGLLGFGYYGAFRHRSAYDWTVEDSVYVREDVRGQGVGKAIVAELLQRAETRGFRQMLALIGDSENIGSIGMHASLGFQRAGVMRACGVKFGRWLDVVIMQRPLGTGDADVPGKKVLASATLEGAESGV